MSNPHKGYPDIAPAPTWKRFCDAPPADGFYWARYPDSKPEHYTIVEVDGNFINFPGDDLCEEIEPSGTWHDTPTSYEYYTQPILPPT